VQNLKRWAKPSQSVWAIIETTRIGHPEKRPRPDQIRAEVWLALVHGARGIGYFVHEFVDGFREDGIFRHPDAVQEVARINRQLAELAPVLNSEDVLDAVDVLGGDQIATLIKRSGEVLFVFAVAKGNQPSFPTFRLRGLQRGTALVMGEERSIPVVDGAFQDAFAGYGVHLYEIRAPPN
jgi:hypothetical protein